MEVVFMGRRVECTMLWVGMFWRHKFGEECEGD